MEDGVIRGYCITKYACAKRQNNAYIVPLLQVIHQNILKLCINMGWISQY